MRHRRDHETTPIIVQGGIDKQSRNIAAQFPFTNIVKCQLVQELIIQMFSEGRGSPGRIEPAQSRHVPPKEGILIILVHGLFVLRKERLVLRAEFA